MTMEESSRDVLLVLEYLSLASPLVLSSVSTWRSSSILLFSPSVHLGSTSFALGLLFLCFYLERRLHSVVSSPPFRRGASVGSWTCLLLPLSLNVSNFDVTPLATVSLFLLASSLSVQFFHLRSSPVVARFLAHSFLFLSGSFFLPFPFLPSLLLSSSSQFIFLCLSSRLPLLCPLQFSFGEVLLISQFVSLSVISTIFHLIPPLPSSFSTQSFAFGQICFVGCLLVVLFPTVSPSARCTSGFLASFMSVGFCFVIPLSCLVLGGDPFTWFLNFLFETPSRLYLFASWTVFLSLAIFVVFAQSSLKVNTTAIIRKYFHFLLLLVFIPGLVLDTDLLRLSSCLLLGVFVLLECIRFLKIPFVAPILDEHFTHFLDEKDQGQLVLSHFWLLMGCSWPLWIHSGSSKFPLYSGLLSIGVGDAFASIGGSLFGVHRWPGTKKTVEGSMSSIVSQLAVSFGLELFSVFSPKTTLALLGVIVSTSLLEAFTSQVDNLVIPLVFYSFSIFTLKL